MVFAVVCEEDFVVILVVFAVVVDDLVVDVGFTEVVVLAARLTLPPAVVQDTGYFEVQ